MRNAGTARRDWWLDTFFVFLLAAALVFPVFRLKYLNNWPSIESTFIADARMFQENWTHYLWQPFWYCGTRADYVYPPGPRYGTAIFALLTRTSSARAYHFVIGLFYAFGIAGVYLWARTGSKSRGAAWLAAAGVALLSPCFLILREIHSDSPWLVPWRLHVLMTYGEGPHISSLAVLPVVWLGAWRRFLDGGVRWLTLSAGAAALAVTINFYGATALAITFPLVAWSCFLQTRDWRIARDSALIAAFAYTLCAWWLAPSYLLITSQNLHLVSKQANAWSLPVLAVILVAYVAFSLRLRRWRRFDAYAFFIWSGLWFLSVYTLGYQWFGFQVAGDAHRLIPEWDLFAILCGAQLVHWIWSAVAVGRLRLALRVAMVLVLVVCFRPSWRYLKHVYVEFPRDPNWQQSVEYRTSDWLAHNAPNQRVMVSGTIRYWYNAWHDGQQVDGGSMQGILNPLLPGSQNEMLHSSDPQLARDWLVALGVDILVVPGPSSREHYKDFFFELARSYDVMFPLLRDDGEGNRYYAVPRRAPGIARVVDRAHFLALPPIPKDYGSDGLRSYVDALEATPPEGGADGRAEVRWLNSDALDVTVEPGEGESLLIEETYDPYWRAYVDGRRVPIQRDAIGFMLVDAPVGKHIVHMMFETPLELIAGRTLTLLALALTIFILA